MGERDDDPVGPDGWPVFIAVVAVLAFTFIVAVVAVTRAVLGG